MKNFLFIILLLLGISPTYAQYIPCVKMEIVFDNCANKKNMDSLLIKEGFKYQNSTKNENSVEYKYKKAKSKQIKSQDISIFVSPDGYSYLSLTSKDKKFLEHYKAELINNGYELTGVAEQRTGNVIEKFQNQKYEIMLFQIIENDNTSLYYLELRNKSVD